MLEVFQKIKENGIVPVVVLEKEGQALQLGKALWDGGLRCVEITFRTKEAEEGIRRMKKEFPEMLIGAGTILNEKQVDAAVSAGAEFIVSPGLNPSVVTYCQKKDIPVIPGIMTPGELESALSLGLDTVKFFPAEMNGGTKMVKTLASVYSGVNFMPTGGISAKNASEYLGLKCVLACGGSWMVKKELLRSNDFETIQKLCTEAAAIAKETGERRQL